MSQPHNSNSPGRIVSPVVEYGRGRAKRRINKAAVLSLVLSLLLAGWAAATYALYSDPEKGWGAIGWLIVVMGMFRILQIAALLLVPVCLLAGVTGWIDIRREPDRLRGRAAALLGIVLSVSVGSAVAYASYWVQREFAEGDAHAVHSIEYKIYNERTEVESLLDDCRIYANRHQGAYPPDLDALSGPLAMDPSVKRAYAYCGQGLIDEPSVDGNYRRYDAANDGLIVVISRQPTADGAWIVGMKGNPYTSHAIGVEQPDLPQVLRHSNQIRQSVGLPPIDFATLLQRGDLASDHTTAVGRDKANP